MKIQLEPKISTLIYDVAYLIGQILLWLGFLEGGVRRRRGIRRNQCGLLLLP